MRPLERPWLRRVNKLSESHEKERRPAFFLDRDGTISHEVGYINHVSRLELFPWAIDAVERLHEAGFLAVVVTNQSGVARGYFSEDLVREVHAKLQAELARGGVQLDAIYYCPHHPREGQPPYRVECECRKPKPGMLHRAAQELGIDLSRSVLVSDKYEDVAMAHGLGLRGVLVLTGYGRGEYEYRRHSWPRPPDLVAENLLDAVNKILGRE